MEKQQLNFSAPLMSARRYSSPLRSSTEDHKKKDPVPERRRAHISQMSEVVKPGSVPFVWEQIPGKAKGGGGGELLHHDSEEPSTTPKLPPGRSLEIIPWTSGRNSGEQKPPCRPPNKLSGELRIRTQNKLSGELVVSRTQTRVSGEINGFVPQTRLCSSNITSVARLESSRDWVVQNSDSDFENDNATFSDAHDTFSRLESLSINCSVSGLSGSECPRTTPHGNLPADAQARDFMMNRFLPAAKAMTLESPQHTSRRQIVVVEQPREVKALVPRLTGPSPPRNVSKIIPYTGHDIGPEETEDEDGDESLDMPNNAVVKACGFLPWFCSKKNSLRMFNPVPAMKLKTKSALSSASKIGRLVKTGSYSTPQSPRKLDYGVQTTDLYRSEGKVNGTNRPMFYSGELRSSGNSLSPYRNYRRGAVSPCRNESPQSVYHKGAGFLAVPKMVRPVDEKGSKKAQSASASPIKTYYAQTSSTLSKTERVIKNSHNEANYGRRLDIMKARGIRKPLPSDTAAKASTTDDQSTGLKPKAAESPNLCRELVVKANDNSPLPPPLPKSPSDSWLLRNLASGSPRNSFSSYSNLTNKTQSWKQNTKAPNSNTKWENIVKSSHLRHDLGRYSEELVTHAPQQSRTK